MATMLERNDLLWEEGEHPTGHQRTVALALTILFGLALVVMIALPGVNYLAMFLLFLGSSPEKVLYPRIGRPPRSVS